MIISILGTTGAKKDNATCKPIEIQNATKALYKSDIIDKKSNNFYNATHFLLENYDDEFVLIGTKCAINFQNELLKESLSDKQVKFIEISDNDLDEVFEVVYELLKEGSDKVILDITHGFRHQPIMAIFASSLSQFLDKKDLKIIFAKEIVSLEEYEYVYLDDYLEITQLSLLLSGFIRTLNFIPISNLKLIDAKVFENFSKALFSNDILGVKSSYQKLLSELDKIRENKDLKYLKHLIEKIEKTLERFNDIDKLPIYEQYMVLSEITLDKNSLVVALAYSFESLREYCAIHFEPILKQKNIKFKNSYTLNTLVMATISNFMQYNKPNKIQQKYPKLYKQNKNIFSRVDKIYQDLRELRNSLAHINKDKNFENIKQEIKKLNFKLESIYKDNPLKAIKT